MDQDRPQEDENRLSLPLVNMPLLISTSTGDAPRKENCRDVQQQRTQPDAEVLPPFAEFNVGSRFHLGGNTYATKIAAFAWCAG